MHNLRNIHSSGYKGILWTVPLLLAVVVGVHLFGVNLFSSGKFYSSVYFWPILIVVVVVGHIWIMHSLRSRTRVHETINEVDIVSRTGLHWHPELTIYVKGEKQEIPHMGISDMDMSAMHKMHKRMQMQHMHEGPNKEGIIHLKFEGLVRKSDITLDQVFKKWGKSMRSFGKNMTMTVNGKENTEYENYVMQDKDKIELRYE